MFDSVTIFTVAILTAIFTVIVVILFYLLKSQKYDQSRNRALIEEMRYSFEKNLYELTDRMVSTQERWMDANHLLLSSQKKEIDIKKEEAVYLSEFLKSNGVSAEDIKIDRKLVFVLTPFNKDFDSTFETVRKICSNVDLKCLRGDEEFIKSDIFVHIIKNLVKANIVIANIDGRNPNVFYELGLAHAMNKNTILISKAKEKLPVDVKSKYMILYETESELESELRKQLLKIYSSIEEPSLSLTDNKIGFYPTSGGIFVSIKGNIKKIRAFGLELRFDPKTIQYVSTSKGNLTRGWAEVEGNEKRPGELSVGGYAGAGSAIEKGSEGSIALIRFKGFSAGTEKSISVRNLTDDLTGMIIAPPSIEFTKIEAEEEEKRKEWKRDREILQNLKQPLREFNQMNRFPDMYRAPKCLELTSKIETEAERIQSPEFREIKEKLLEYSRRKEHIDQNTPLKDLMKLFQRPIDDKYEPGLLLEEIEEAIKKISV